MHLEGLNDRVKGVPVSWRAHAPGQNSRTHQTRCKHRCLFTSRIDVVIATTCSVGSRRIAARAHRSEESLNYCTSRTRPSPPHTISDTSGHLLKNTSPLNEHSANSVNAFCPPQTRWLPRWQLSQMKPCCKTHGTPLPPPHRNRKPIAGKRVAGWSCWSGHGETPGLELAQNPV